MTQGAANVSYTTPAYVSMDQPRAVTLFFSSALLRPMSFVQVDATDQSSQAPVRMSLRVRDELGSWMTFADGTTEIFYAAGSGTTRLAAQFKELRGAPLAYSYTLVVRSWWADGGSTESTITVRVAKVGGGTTEFGLGWTVMGLQKLYNQEEEAEEKEDGVHVVENGTGTFFKKVCEGADCRYPGPDGDFTTIRWDGSGWRRIYSDSTVVRFAAYDGNTLGRMEWVEDRFGNRTTYGYDTSNRLTSITDPTDQAITFGYNVEGVLSWIEDPMGRRVNTTVSSGYLWRFFDPDSSLALDLHFDVVTRQLKHRWDRGADRDTAGTGWDYAYDAFGQLASVTAPQVSTTDAGVTRPVTAVQVAGGRVAARGHNVVQQSGTTRAAAERASGDD